MPSAQDSYRFIHGTHMFLPREHQRLRERLEVDSEMTTTYVYLVAGAFFRVALPAAEACVFFTTLESDDDPVREFIRYVLS